MLCRFLAAPLIACLTVCHMLCRDFDKFYKWDTVVKQVDMCLVSMPRQDWSPAGSRRGATNLREQLLECITRKLARVWGFEEVPEFYSGGSWGRVEVHLKGQGYHVSPVMFLNTKEVLEPQSRLRGFVIAWLGDGGLEAPVTPIETAFKCQIAQAKALGVHFLWCYALQSLSLQSLSLLCRLEEHPIRHPHSRGTRSLWHWRTNARVGGQSQGETVARGATMAPERNCRGPQSTPGGVAPN